ncbi:carbohydrate kinase family protein [Clostridium mediterraneense]|uniref:carbohydrate kinase family protein n=1 Tax=Clostridium mediterraneense TaxID=1805472 RepID=UPI00082AF786|nr:carbohydrate kinase family protein [Clostridium mediterraneense]
MNTGKEPYILVFGAAIVDIFGFSRSKYRSYNSTPGEVKMSYGGVCRNIAENMARVGANVKFISILGDDSNGQQMMEHGAKHGYDMSDSLILKGMSTPTYLAVLDENGEMVSAIVDMKSIDRMTPEFIDSKREIIENAEYVVLDADNPAIMEYLLTNFSDKTKFILDPVSAEKAGWVKHLVKYFHTIKPNRHEAEILAGFPIIDDDDLIRASNYFIELGVEKVFISLDADGIFYNDGKECGKICSGKVKVVNVTGAGDSFVAGMGYGYLNGLSSEETVKFSISMSVLTIAHEQTIHPEMCYEKVIETANNMEWTVKKL